MSSGVVESTPSEAAYYVSIIQDVVVHLAAFLQRLDAPGGIKKDVVEGEVEQKINRVMCERLPKLLQSLWKEICAVIAAIIRNRKEGSTGNCGGLNELAEFCKQLFFFKSISRCGMALLSRKVLSTEDDTAVRHRRVAKLLRLRENTGLLLEACRLSEWMSDFLKQLFIAVELDGGTWNTKLIELEISLSSIKESTQEPNDQSLNHPRNQQEPQQQQQSVSPVTLEGNGDVFDDESILLMHLGFFRAACIGTADDILKFVKQNVAAPPPVTCVDESGTAAARDGDMMPNDSGAEEFRQTAHLIAGESRWLFFRVRPHGMPPLTVDEVAFQVREFYKAYNPHKISMAMPLAQLYGEDYTDLFDALEYRYCFTT